MSVRSNWKLEERNNGPGYCGYRKSVLAGNRTLVVQFVASHYGDCAIPTHEHSLYDTIYVFRALNISHHLFLGASNRRS
jgi:hypothetical protein